MEMCSLSIREIKIFVPKIFCDDRGCLSETYNYRTFLSLSVDINFVQDVYVSNIRQYTVRGLHFQRPPYAQAKLVRVGRGQILDVAVDIRRDSPTYGDYATQVISAESRNQMLIPAGFAHGYLTLEPDTEMLYKVSCYHSPEHESGLLWNDPDIAIDWGVSPTDVFVSDRDKNQPRFSDLRSPFS